MTKDIKWEDWKMTDPEETLKIFRKVHKKYLVSGIDVCIIIASEPEDKMPVHIIPDEGESVRQKKSDKSSDLIYQNKDTDTDTETSSYNKVWNVLKKIDKSYNPTVQRINEPIIDGNDKV